MKKRTFTEAEIEVLVDAIECCAECESVTNDDEGASIWCWCDDFIDHITQNLASEGFQYKVHDMLKEGDITKDEWEDEDAHRWRIDIEFALSNPKCLQNED